MAGGVRWGCALWAGGVAAHSSHMWLVGWAWDGRCRGQRQTDAGRLVKSATVFMASRFRLSRSCRKQVAELHCCAKVPSACCEWLAAACNPAAGVSGRASGRLGGRWAGISCNLLACRACWEVQTTDQVSGGRGSGAVALLGPSRHSGLRLGSGQCLRLNGLHEHSRDGGSSGS
jgi:hypothetical protein